MVKPRGRRPQPFPSAGRVDQPFPLEVAAIDMGSNAIRFTAARFEGRDSFSVLAKDRAPVRLGHSVFRTGRLTGPAMDAAVGALQGFAAQLDDAGIDHYRAVATSAVRDSRNRNAFVRRVAHETGLHVEVITGAEEARLVHRAARSRVPMTDGCWMLADLGGGSLEVALVNEAGVVAADSLSIGTVRLIEELGGATMRPDVFEHLVDEALNGLRLDRMQPTQPQGLIASGGNMEAIADLTSAPKQNGTAVVTREAIVDLIQTLAQLTVAERVDRFGLRADRADVILPAAMVYARIAKLVGVERLHVPNVGVREGVLLDLADALSAREAHGQALLRQAETSALALGRRFAFDEPHGIQVAALAMLLFDQLAPLHGLGPRDRDILHTAALLHDVGQTVAYKGHHKHSQYIIETSDLAGATPRHARLAALVARYHRKAAPSAKHKAYRSLKPRARDRVTRMSALLRVADALDREHQRNVRDLEVDMDQERVLLRLEGTSDLMLERWAVQKKAALFEAVFGLRIETATKEWDP